MSILFSHFFQKINQISPLEADFTEVLASIAVMPKMLYFCGKMPQNVVKTAKNSANRVANRPAKSPTPERPKSVAIVGSRHNTRYGEEVAYRLAYELGRRGAVVVSGLAYGIDSIAHRGCLAAGGTTVAVLGNALDHIHPREHTQLAAEIIKHGGAVISEYAPHTPEYANAPLAPGEYLDPATGQRRLDHKASFLHRNRLISGLADIVVVVEAAERSGSLNTATHALDQGKSVYAVPGNITSTYSQGCNRLIAQGATPYTSPVDILRELYPEDYIKRRRSASIQITGDNPAETSILQALHAGARTTAEIIALTQLTPETLSQSLTMLELGSRIRPLGAGNYALA